MIEIPHIEEKPSLIPITDTVVEPVIKPSVSSIRITIKIGGAETDIDLLDFDTKFPCPICAAVSDVNMLTLVTLSDHLSRHKYENVLAEKTAAQMKIEMKNLENTRSRDPASVSAPVPASEPVPIKILSTREYKDIADLIPGYHTPTDDYSTARAKLQDQLESQMSNDQLQELATDLHHKFAEDIPLLVKIAQARDNAPVHDNAPVRDTAPVRTATENDNEVARIAKAMSLNKDEYLPLEEDIRAAIEEDLVIRRYGAFGQREGFDRMREANARAYDDDQALARAIKESSVEYSLQNGMTEDDALAQALRASALDAQLDIPRTVDSPKSALPVDTDPMEKLIRTITPSQLDEMRKKVNAIAPTKPTYVVSQPIVVTSGVRRRVEADTVNFNEINCD